MTGIRYDEMPSWFITNSFLFQVAVSQSHEDGSMEMRYPVLAVGSSGLSESTRWKSRHKYEVGVTKSQQASLFISAYKDVSVVLYTYFKLQSHICFVSPTLPRRRNSKETRTSFKSCYIFRHLTYGTPSSAILLNRTVWSWPVASEVRFAYYAAARCELPSLGRDMRVCA
nr:hypothetical protein CFP56_09946 [Quercus suber]